MDIKVDLFREYYLFSREDVLISLELFIEHEKANEGPGHSINVVKSRIKLCEKLCAAVKKCKLPVLIELWWFYDYQFLGDHMELNLCQADDIKFRMMIQ